MNLNILIYIKIEKFLFPPVINIDKLVKLKVTMAK